MKPPKLSDLATEWAVYGARYRKMNDGRAIGDDRIAGPHWQRIGEGIMWLLRETPQELTPGLEKFMRREMRDSHCEFAD